MKTLTFTRGQFIASAWDDTQFPVMRTASGNMMPEIAIVGKSNVGKSSLINSLLRDRKIAKVSSTPGKTQSINFFTVDEQLSLVDLPGYGYAKVSWDVKQKWGPLIDAYLTARKNLKLILFLIDSRRDPAEQDMQFAQWAKRHGISLFLIFTKADKASDREKKENTLHYVQLLPDVHFLHYSIKDPCARMDLIHQLCTYLEEK